MVEAAKNPFVQDVMGAAPAALIGPGYAPAIFLAASYGSSAAMRASPTRAA